MFNKPTNLTFEEFQKKYSKTYNLLAYPKCSLTKWIFYKDMTKEEKEAHPEYKLQGGYLKRFNFKEVCRQMWDGFNKTQRNQIKKLPNFDKEIFKEITGIEV